MRVSWLTSEQDERKFLEALVSDAPIELFKNDNISILIEYLWNIGFPYFLFKGFLPFMYLSLLPTILVPISQKFLLNDDDTINYTAAILHIIFLILMTIGNIRDIYWELTEIYKSGVSYL